MERVVAKFKLQSIKQMYGTNGQSFSFSAVGPTDTEIPENERYHKYTPSGTVEIHIDNPSAQEFFKLGESYYLDFTRPQPVDQK